MQQLLWLVLLLIFLLQQFLQALPPTDVTTVAGFFFAHFSSLFNSFSQSQSSFYRCNYYC
jgi:hypothetical protein